VDEGTLRHPITLFGGVVTNANGEDDWWFRMDVLCEGFGVGVENEIVDVVGMETIKKIWICSPARDQYNRIQLQYLRNRDPAKRKYIGIHGLLSLTCDLCATC
jgi:hypothetical protein